MAQQLGKLAVLPKKQSIVPSLLPTSWLLSLTLAPRSLTPSSGFHGHSHSCGIYTQAYVHEREFKIKNEPPKAILPLLKERGRLGQIALDLGRRSLWSIIEDQGSVPKSCPSNGKINLLYASRLYKNLINDYGLGLKIQWSVWTEEQITKARGAVDPPVRNFVHAQTV